MIPLYILAIEDDNDRAFMAELFQSYNRLMYREIFQIVGDSWAAEDVLQETLIKLIDKVAELRKRDKKQLVSYIISASKNRARNYVRDIGRNTALSFDEQIEHEDLASSGEEIELQLIKEQDLERFASVWSELDERSRHLLEGRYILEKTNQELADELGIKPDSVRMALIRARKNAYQLLEKTIL